MIQTEQDIKKLSRKFSSGINMTHCDQADSQNRVEIEEVHTENVQEIK